MVGIIKSTKAFAVVSLSVTEMRCQFEAIITEIVSKYTLVYINFGAEIGGK